MLWASSLLRSRFPRRDEPAPPVVNLKNATFGNILQSKNRLPLYYWSVERRAGGNVLCTYPPNTVLCNDVDGWFVVRA